MVSIDKGDLMRIAADLETFAVGFISAADVAAGKANPGAPLDTKLWILISHVAGVDAAVMISGKSKDFLLSQGASQGPTITPFGMFNKTMFSGAGLLALDALFADKLAGLGYSKIRRFVTAAGTGLLLGGIIGGLFDPPADGLSQSQINALPSVNRRILS